jgi:hypothetical protein
MAMNFNERVFCVVRNFIEYGNYGKDKKKAVATIHHHHPEIPLSECDDAFNAFLQVYSDTISFVNANKDHYRAIKNDPPAGKWPTTKEEAAFFREHDNVPEDIIRAMIWFIYDWRHVR